MTAPNLDIVAKLYHLDPDTFPLGAGGIRRWDGTPATPEEVEAFRASRLVDWEATLELHRHALEQSQYKVDRQQRILELLNKYRRESDTSAIEIDTIAGRMSPKDRSEYYRLWDDLGNIMVLTGGAR
jgi:hypothetical protein